MQDMKSVLVVGEAGEERDSVAEALTGCGAHCLLCANLDDASTLLAQHEFNAIFCRDTFPGVNLATIVRTLRPVPVVVVSRIAEWPAYLSALRAGAFDYIACPPNPAETERILGAALAESSRHTPLASTAA